MRLKHIEELFDIQNGIPSKDVNRVSFQKNDNWIPYIRPSYKQDTSIDAYVNRYQVPSDMIYPQETIYVSTDGQGSHTYSYVSTMQFVPNSFIQCVSLIIVISFHMVASPKA